MPALNPLAGLNRMPVTRIVATPHALNRLKVSPLPADAAICRVAADEILIAPPIDALGISDSHAIIITDTSFAGLWLPTADADYALARLCEWELPSTRPAFAQGAVAGIPAKLWLTTARTLILVPAPYATEFAERLSEHVAIPTQVGQGFAREVAP